MQDGIHARLDAWVDAFFRPLCSLCLCVLCVKNWREWRPARYLGGRVFTQRSQRHRGPREEDKKVKDQFVSSGHSSPFTRSV
jgi:hypothetical protein